MLGKVKTYNEFVFKRLRDIDSDVVKKSVVHFKIGLFEVFHFVDT